MTTEELMLPRYKVIAEWPNGDLPKGLIVTNFSPGKWGDFKEYEFSESELWFKRYPHLFKKLLWFEERELPQLPEYGKKIFATKQCFDEYIKKNKPTLSLNDVLSCCHDEMSGNGVLYLFEEKLNELVNSKM